MKGHQDENAVMHYQTRIAPDKVKKSWFFSHVITIKRDA
jgi:hypothetical protein